MQKNLNMKVKFRESFRPFAPAIIFEYLEEWFNFKMPSPYMLMVSSINENKRIVMTAEEEKLFGIEKLNIARSKVPAITHVDYSSRIQTVEINKNKKFYELINEFNKITNCPILINTSFNVRGEPIVCSPSDALMCFMGTDIDILCIGDFCLEKNEQVNLLKEDYKSKYELD